MVPLMLLAVAPAAWPILLYDNGTFTIGGGPKSDFSSIQAGDNFTLSTAGTAQQIQWWGFYAESAFPAQDDFIIRFFSFTGGVPDTTPFASYAIGNNVTRTDTGQDFSSFDIFEFSATIPDTALAAGTSYLLSIVGNTTEDFFWSFDGSGNRWVRTSEGQSWIEASTSNLAFNISGTVGPPAVPEGGTSALLLGVAFLALLAFRWRLAGALR
ncbi:MAG TPA: hypothetical protein VIS99_05270 [Terrimicrobiaceae bacterium]